MPPRGKRSTIATDIVTPCAMLLGVSTGDEGMKKGGDCGSDVTLRHVGRRNFKRSVWEEDDVGALTVLLCGETGSRVGRGCRRRRLFYGGRRRGRVGGLGVLVLSL